MQLTWSTNKANMKTKELSKEVRHKVVEKHCSGEGYKKISKSRVIPLSTVKSIINEWKTYHTTHTLHRSGHSSKVSSRTSRKLVGDVTVNSTKICKAQYPRWRSVFINQQCLVPFRKLPLSTGYHSNCIYFVDVLAFNLGVFYRFTSIVIECIL